ncbi:LysR family transcriptional regulator [Hahella sp. CCB-MM4]|uniref:LysR family transcriptional regulator n=1 Tax=Hahella sp. (strain CCB-MM4) TaxID=1926491 RepID=UPI000B9C3B4C|nr:LysR family transcriptional regulator [Hahella sp. CCB-MM4]OZG71648.1 LysR family transcriptional regulator [Hahella sp. CCB-MM4]
MIANSQYRLSASDLEILLALSRGGTLAAAGERMGVDGSTVFRALQRVEKGLGVSLFERTRAGYLPSDVMLTLIDKAESIELALEQANSMVQESHSQVSGNVRITTTDILMQGLVIPVLAKISREHPLLTFEFDTSNQLASLTKREADIAVRATRKPPEHLIGRHLGPIRMALYKSPSLKAESLQQVMDDGVAWIAPDEALPNHPSVQWRRKHYPRVMPTYLVDSILSVLECVKQGLGVGVMPLFLAQQHDGLVQLGDPIDESQTELWLLSHPESRHLLRVATVYRYLIEHLSL